VTNGPCAAPTDPSPELRRQRLPKSRRLLKPAEFRQVYDRGFKVPCACFVAFCWKSPDPEGPKIGFTAPRALGKATRRNRMKRRVREAVRRELGRLAPEWRIVWNLRRASEDAPQQTITVEVARVLDRCRG
jgi:ribonuclease P protein component